MRHRNPLTNSVSLSNKAYDLLQWVARYLLPALGTLYFALDNIWDLPYAENIIGTIAALITFLGLILGLSSVSYVNRGGELRIDKSDPDALTCRVLLNNPNDLKDKDTVIFNVVESREIQGL